VTSSVELIDRPLSGRTVVVTRAAEQAGALADRLVALGAEVVDVPTLAFVEPDDAGAALGAAVATLREDDWIVVTSSNGAERVARAAPPGGLASGVRVAVIGPGTAAACERLGVAVDLVPARFVGEGLVDAFPNGPGRVVVAQAAGARPVVAAGLAAKGWQVEAVVAYRTVPAAVPAPRLAAAAGADAITFTSASTVAAYLAAAGRAAVPRTVVCIGPVTAAAAERTGLLVAAVAAEPTLDALVAATVEALQ
jgi:uroporphyrinogen III methyltransferase/synthase